ncbi:MAG: hypothetical protein ACE5GK_00765 [Nitrospiria bacterium]
MIKFKKGFRFVLPAVFFLVFGVGDAYGRAEKKTYDCNAVENKAIRTTIDMKLAKKWKKKKKEIKNDVIDNNDLLKVRLSFFPFLDPPMNLGVGKCVSAEDGRIAIKKALEYNRGIGFVVMQELLPHHWIRIGLTDLAELAWIPVTPKDISRLADPSLTTDQFQSVYRELATLKERKLPFGMGTKEIEVPPEE